MQFQGDYNEQHARLSLEHVQRRRLRLQPQLRVRRYLPLLRFSVPVTIAFTVAVIALDVCIPMPWTWTVGEAASLSAWTVALWWLVRRVDDSSEAPR